MCSFCESSAGRHNNIKNVLEGLQVNKMHAAAAAQATKSKHSADCCVIAVCFLYTTIGFEANVGLLQGAQIKLKFAGPVGHKAC